MKSWAAILTSIILFLLTSCREASEGCCDDALGINFQPESEERSCCDYPKVFFTIRHLWRPESMDTTHDLSRYNEPLLIENMPADDSFYISEVAWFIQGFEFYVDPKWHSLDTEVSLPLVNDENEIRVQDFGVQSLRVYLKPLLGEFRMQSIPDSIRFTLGYSDIPIDTTSFRISEVSPLVDAVDANLVDPAKSIKALHLTLVRARDSLALDIPLEWEKSVSLGLPYVVFDRAINRNVIINVYYDELLQNINVNGSVENISQIIKTNLNSLAFELDTIY